MRFVYWIAATTLASAALAQTSSEPKGPVDQLIPWLLDEDQQLRGIPFSEVIFDTTGKRVLPFDANKAADQRLAKAIAAACDETMKRLNAPNSEIQNVERINEVSSHFEDLLLELLNATPGLRCDFPLTAEGKVQRSGYPDLRIVDLESKRIFYWDPKLYAVGSRDSSFRAFYFEPKIHEQKCAMTRCTSWSDLSICDAKPDWVLRIRLGTSRDGTLLIFLGSA
jgi:hypothetical protein